MEQFWSAELLYGIGALVLVLSSLSLRNMGKGDIAKAILAWVAIFAVVFAGFSLLQG